METEVKTIETTKANLEEELRQHKTTATIAREYYKSTIDRCRQQWNTISQLTTIRSPTRTERDELQTARHCFTLVISADYQQSKLIPSWGRTEQPGSTYYLQKVSHDIFGIVDHREEKSVTYVFDERIGPKNTDHTVSLLTQFWQNVSHEHPWINRLAIFLDNATSTNKNKYLFSWAMEMVSSGKVDHVHISFMIAGHTKFAPDRLFSIIGSAYKSEDVFTIDELKAICDTCAKCYIEKGDMVHTWRDSITQKYSDLPGVRKYHDFLIVKSHDSGVVMKVRENCFSGSWSESPLHADADGTPTITYRDTRTRQLTSEKMANIITMYDRFISPHRRPDYLPSCNPSTSTALLHPQVRLFLDHQLSPQTLQQSPVLEDAREASAQLSAVGTRTRPNGLKGTQLRLDVPGLSSTRTVLLLCTVMPLVLLIISTTWSISN